MQKNIISLLALLLLVILSLPTTIKAQEKSLISFNPDTNIPYAYDIQLKIIRGSNKYFKLTNQLSFSNFKEGYKMMETIDKFAVLSGDKLRFNLSTSFTEGSERDKIQTFLKNLMLTKTISEEGESLSPWDYSHISKSHSLSDDEKQRARRILEMFSQQFPPFYADIPLSANTEFSRRTLTPSFARAKNDTTYFRTDYEVLQKTDSTTLLSYQREPESTQKDSSKLTIKGMAIIENSSGMLMHRRELSKNFGWTEYQMVFNRNDAQKFSLTNPLLDSNIFLGSFESFSKEPDTLDRKKVAELFSKQKLSYSFDSKEEARQYIHSLEPFLFYRKFRYADSGQLISKKIGNDRYISTYIKWVKGFDSKGKEVFTFNFSEDEQSFIVPQGEGGRINKVPNGQFIIPDTTDSIRGSIDFYTEIGSQSQKLSQKDISKKIDFQDTAFKILSWDERTVSYIGFGGLTFYDSDENIVLPQEATVNDYYVSQLTALLDKPANELTNDDFLLYSNIDGFHGYLPHYTLQFAEPVSHAELFVPDKIHTVNRTFVIEKR